MKKLSIQKRTLEIMKLAGAKLVGVTEHNTLYFYYDYEIILHPWQSLQPIPKPDIYGYVDLELDVKIYILD